MMTMQTGLYGSAGYVAGAGARWRICARIVSSCRAWRPGARPHAMAGRPACAGKHRAGQQRPTGADGGDIGGAGAGLVPTARAGDLIQVMTLPEMNLRISGWSRMSTCIATQVQAVLNALRSGDDGTVSSGAA